MLAMVLTLSALADLLFPAFRKLHSGRLLLRSSIETCIGASVCSSHMWTLALLCWRPAYRTDVSVTVRWGLFPLLSLCATVVSASSLLQGQVADLCLQGSLRQQPAWLTAAITEDGLSGCALGSTLSGQLHTPGTPKVAATMLLQYKSGTPWLKSCSCTVRWVNAPSGQYVWRGP